MLSTSELKRFAREAVALLSREHDLGAFEVYCSSAEERTLRLNYTSDIPSRGVEEFKSLAADGLALRIVMRRDPRECGSGFVAGELGPEAVREALSRARHAAVVDPHFPGLPRDARRPGAERGAAGALMRLGDGALAASAWEIISGALEAFAARAPAGLNRAPGLVVGGDLSVVRDRVVVAGSKLNGARADESAYFRSSITVLIESREAKGTASALGATVAELREAARRLGRAAVGAAFRLAGGERPEPKPSRLLLGPQPVAEILNYMVLPSLTTGAFHAANSAYHGRFGRPVMDGRLSLSDEPGMKGGAVRRRLTCEGLAAKRSELVHDGRLVGLLSNYYDSHRLLTDEHRAEKLGVAASGALEFPPRNGYRLGEAMGRRFDAHPASFATNVVMRARGGLSERELIEAVGEGLYVGRLWYTYPINGQRAGDFTATITGDSYVIRGGRLAAPLAPNCLRINANIRQVFESVAAVGSRRYPAAVWGSPEAYYVPHLLADGIPLSAVGAAS